MKLLTCAVVLALSGSAWADPPRRGGVIPLPVENNPFVELYRIRVSQQELNLERLASLQQLAQAKLARARRLIAARAISAEEFDVLTSEATVTTADRALGVKKLDEEKTYLRIVEELVKRGVGIALCTTETE